MSFLRIYDHITSKLPKSWRTPTAPTTGGNQRRPFYVPKRIDHYVDRKGRRYTVTVLEGHSRSRTYFRGAA
jgi:hypothetical protein